MSAPTLLELPYPPSVNHYWTPIVRFNPHTRMHYATLVLSPAAKTYHEETGWFCLSQRPRVHGWPLYGALMLTLRITPPDGRRRDRDNILKAIADTLVRGGVIVDDELIKEIHLYSLPPMNGGRVDVCIEMIDQCAA